MGEALFPTYSSRLVERLSRLDSVSRRHITVTLVVISVLAVMKVGPRPTVGWLTGHDVIPLLPQRYRPWLDYVPDPWRDWAATTTSNVVLISLSFALTIVFITTIGWLLVRRLSNGQALVVFSLILLGPWGTSLIAGAFALDGLFVVGATLIIFGWDAGWQLRVPGLAILIYANPGQALVGGLCLLGLSLIPLFHAFQMRAGLVSLGGLGLLVLERTFGAQASQAGAFGDLLSSSVNSSLYTLPLRVLTLYGLFWVVILGLLISLPRVQVAIGFLALVMVPTIVVVSTLDGTRVGVGVTILVVLAITSALIASRPDLLAAGKGAPPVVISLLLVTPVPVVWMGAVEVPYLFIADQVGALISA